METMRLRAIQQPGFVRSDMNKNEWQRCYE
jgi:hypothetical protein